MLCPYCQSKKLKVINTRSSSGNNIRRRRHCEDCKRRFTTREHISDLDLIVIKRNGSKQKYDRGKLSRGIYRSCEKRPITDEEIKKIIAQVEAKLCGTRRKEVKSSTIGNLVLKHLQKLDKIAYLRFASVFYPFVKIEDFEGEIEKLVREGKKNFHTDR